MALVRRLEAKRKDRNSVHEEASASYVIFDGLDGNRYVQIDTFGSRDRQIPGKVSQSLQFDRETARNLVDILTREFSL